MAKKNIADYFDIKHEEAEKLSEAWFQLLRERKIDASSGMLIITGLFSSGLKTLAEAKDSIRVALLLMIASEGLSEVKNILEKQEETAKNENM